MSVTRKQQLFVDEYLVDLCGAQAAIRAGYSRKTARQIASELLTKPDIQAAIAAAYAARADRLGVSQDRVVKELMAIAFATLTDVATWSEEGELEIVPSSELSEETAAALKEIRSTTSTITFQEHERSTVYKAIKQHDKLRALELLGKHLGMFKERVEHSGTIGLTLTDLVRRAGEGESGEQPAR